MNKELILNNQTEIGSIGIIATLINFINQGDEIIVQTDKITDNVCRLNLTQEENYFDNIPTTFFTEYNSNADKLYNFIGQANIDKAYIDDCGDIAVNLETGEVLNIERF